MDVKNEKNCQFCLPKYTLSKDKVECVLKIPNCEVFTSAIYNSCELCKPGFSIKTVSKINVCSPNFEDGITSKCKPGFTISG